MANGKDQESKGTTRVRMDEIYRQDPVPAPQEVPALTRIGFKLAICVMAYLAIVTVLLLVDYIRNVPAFPTGLPLQPNELTQFKELSDISLNRTIKLLDTLVLKGFLPVLMAVLGYIFGTRGADREAT